MCPGVALVAGVPIVSSGAVLTYQFSNAAVRGRLEKQLGGVELPSTSSASFMSGVTGAIFFGISRTLIVNLPFFQEGGMWSQPTAIKTWKDFWKATGPRALGTIGCLIGSFAVAGAVKPHFDLGMMPHKEKERMR